MIIDGREIAKAKEEIILKKLDLIKENNDRLPKLVVVLVGDNPASLSYVSQKEKKAASLGILHETINLSEQISESELIEVIEKLNTDKTVDAILVQLPLPKHINEREVLEKIVINKDVDGFKEENIGKLFLGSDATISCTPKGIMSMFEYTKTDLLGKNVVIVGRSNIVGKPLIPLLLKKDATVTITHSKTKDLVNVCKKADILIVAIGRAKFITKEYTNPNQVIIDVGINRHLGKIVGDVDFENIHEHVKAISRVPFGVGPLTIISLMENTMALYEKNIKN